MWRASSHKLIYISHQAPYWLAEIDLGVVKKAGVMMGMPKSSLAVVISDPVQSLEQLPFFYDFTHQEVRRIAIYVREVTFSPREPIYSPGNISDRIYFVISGLVRLYSEEASGKAPGDFIVRSRGVFGEDSAFDESPRGLGAQAMMRTYCLSLSSKSLRDLELDHPRIAIKLLRKLARTTSLRLRQAVGRQNQPTSETLQRQAPATKWSILTGPGCESTETHEKSGWQRLKFHLAEIGRLCFAV